MTVSPIAVTAGQLVFVEDIVRGEFSPKVTETTIAKVGRIWATLALHKSLRFALVQEDDDGLIWLDDSADFSTRGRVWLSAEAHTAYVTRLEAWTKVRSFVLSHNDAPEAVPTDALVALVALLDAS